MPRPGGGSIGHSKHRKAFGSKWHRSAWAIMALSRLINKQEDERADLSRAHRNEFFTSVRELFKQRKIKARKLKG